jgi:hypothetical protein
LVASYTPEEFGVTNSVDVEWMNTRLCPMPWHTHDQPLRITNPQAKNFLNVISRALNLDILSLRLKTHPQVGIITN